MNKIQTAVAHALKVTPRQVEIVLKMLNEGSTVPFIARYRKDKTDNLNEEQIQEIFKVYTYNQDLQKRKETIIKSLTDKDLLTKEVEQAIISAAKKSDLEAIYEPFKTGKKTKATAAIAMGLEPLAKAILTSVDPYFKPYYEAKKYLNDQVKDVEFALEQSKLIIAQIISTNIKIRAIVEEQIHNYGEIVTKAKPKGQSLDTQKKFESYYDHSEKLRLLPNHRIMAIDRAVDMKIISLSFTYQKKTIEYKTNEILFKNKATGRLIHEALQDSLKRLIYPSIENKVWSQMFEVAQNASIKLFANNLEQMLLMPAVRDKNILAIDPGFVSGCKVAVLDAQGNVKSINIFYLNSSKEKKQIYKKRILNIIDRYGVDIIVIGNGTASRETETFIANMIKEYELDLKFAVVSEVGASVYSASKIAVEEFPDLSIEQRSAINIGRRFQDPLNELVKIDPKAIGVGQYQHDVDQKQLKKALEFKTEKIVNSVGVDLNSATKEILTYVSGISPNIAKNIIEYRNEIGHFVDRMDVKKVKGLGAKTFEQSIGFLRIHDSKNYFDKTFVHPESYVVAKKFIKHLNIDLENIDQKNLENIDQEKIAKDLETNIYVIQMIIDALIAPNKDIRDDKEGFELRDDILDFKDIEVGMNLKGTVQNITDFGIFVYVGIKQAVFVHVSNMSDDFIKHPSNAVKTNDKVKVEIIAIDQDRNHLKGKLIEGVS